MKDFLQNLVVVIVCVVMVLGALTYTGFLSLDKIMEASGMSTKTTAVDSYPEVPIIEDQAMPSAVEKTPENTQYATTRPLSPKVQGSIYPLEPAKSASLGREGLLPATPIAVVKNRTATRVEFDTCTVSFSLPSKTGNFSYAVTAGHCGKPGQKIYSKPYGGDFSSAIKLGEIVHSSEMNEATGATDWAVIKLDPKAKRPSHSTKITLALDTYPRPIDKTVCKRGSTTGFDCGKKGEDGVKTQLRVSDNNQQEVIAVLSKAYMCALPGDSGAPIFDKEGIIGVLSSTSASQNDINNHRCATNNVAFYSPITSVVAEIEKAVPDVSL